MANYGGNSAKNRHKSAKNIKRNDSCFEKSLRVLVLRFMGALWVGAVLEICALVYLSTYEIVGTVLVLFNKIVSRTKLWLLVPFDT